LLPQAERERRQKEARQVSCHALGVLHSECAC
jgi:hypothetical protein